MKIQKELKDISWNITEAQYRADNALSYSVLARYEREGFDNLDHLFDKISTPSLTMGSMVDTLITGSQEEFDNLFYIADIPSIGDKEKAIADSLFSQYGNQYTSFIDIPFDAVLNEANAQSYYKNWKDDTRVRVLTERCAIYYAVKANSEGKTVVDLDTYYKVMAMVKALKESPATHGYFAEDDEMSPVRRYYQLKFKAKLNDVIYRCMADEIIVDYESKEIYLIDLKTSSKPEWDFFKSFIDWNYACQARLYYRIIATNLKYDEYFKDFKIHDYRFIVVNKNSLIPLVWEFKDTKKIGELKYGKNKQIVIRDPLIIGMELRKYLDCKPNVPANIVEAGLNDIVECLNNM